MDYPRWVFTTPGPLSGGKHTYGQQLVNNEKEHKAALEAGFFNSIPEALGTAEAVPEPVVVEPAVAESVAAEAVPEEAPAGKKRRAL